MKIDTIFVCGKMWSIIKSNAYALRIRLYAWNVFRYILFWIQQRCIFRRHNKSQMLLYTDNVNKEPIIPQEGMTMTYATIQSPAENDVVYTDPREVSRVNLSAVLYERPENTRVVYFLHGNKGQKCPSNIAQTLDQWHHDTFIIYYRGYGESYTECNDITEEGIYADARAGMQYLLDRYAIEDIVLYGRSLGTGVASYLASMYRENIRTLILESPYRNMPIVVNSYLPTRIIGKLPDELVKYQFPVAQHINEMDKDPVTGEWKTSPCRVYMIFAGNDRVIQYDSTLIDLTRSNDNWVIIPGAGHHNLYLFSRYHSFLSKILRYKYDPEVIVCRPSANLFITQ